MLASSNPHEVDGLNSRFLTILTGSMSSQALGKISQI
jgi:hypothetical protein